MRSGCAAARGEGELAPTAWYAHGYAVWSGGAVALAGAWILWRGARRWPAALWGRLRGLAYIPGELARAHLTITAGLLLFLAGGGIVGLEWGLRGFQTVGSPALVGQLEIDSGPPGVSATWSDWYGRSTTRWTSPCTRLSLEGEEIEWGKLARALGFRDRHRVTGGRLSSPPEAPGADCPGRVEFRPPEAAWILLERGRRFAPLARTRELESPPLRVSAGTWRVYVVPGGYAFSE